jgi:hypothetical protein
LLGEVEGKPFTNASDECRVMQIEISNIPPGILKLLSPRLAKKFLKLIGTWCSGSLYSSAVLYGDSRARNILFKAVFRSFVTRYVQKLEIRCISKRFVLDVILENLGSVPGLLELYLDTLKTDSSSLLAGLVHLENLQIFTYRTNCTDEIIAQLQQYCPLLTELDVSYSRGVTNASVQPLRAARKLKFLDIYKTRIDDEHYGLLLSELPNVANITIRRKETSILGHIAVERLDTITQVKADVQEPDTYIHIWPNRSIIGMSSISEDVSDLSAFNALRVLEIHHLGCSSLFTTILQAVGHRLTDLKLSHCWNADIQDIITLCPSLTDLSVIRCSFFYSHPQTPLVLQLPHFRNLINLKMCNFYRYRNQFFYLPYYVSVKTVELMFTGDFDRLVREILDLGTYKQLEVLRLQLTAPRLINMKALELLIGHCPVLKRIELEGTADADDFGELKRQMSLQNFDLKFKLRALNYEL